MNIFVARKAVDVHGELKLPENDKLTKLFRCQNIVLNVVSESM